MAFMPRNQGPPCLPSRGLVFFFSSSFWLGTPAVSLFEVPRALVPRGCGTITLSCSKKKIFDFAPVRPDPFGSSSDYCRKFFVADFVDSFFLLFESLASETHGSPRNLPRLWSA